MSFVQDIYSFRFKKVFVICAAYYKTGGTEVLHQLVYNINRLGGNAYITYIRLYDSPSLCNPAFSEYVKDHILEIDDIEDVEGNAIVIPEGYPEYNARFSHAYKMLWWLSVDNFEGIYKFDDKKIDKVHEEFRDTISLHLTQSEYAYEYLIGKGVPKDRILHLGDYLNDVYFSEDASNDRAREDIVVYNPRKGQESTKNIMDADPSIRYVPLQNMTSEEARELMRRAKVYIDFGNHPGKDRIPREAAMCGCIVVTGRHGSAANPVDIRIPEKYKLKEEDVSASQVAGFIRECIETYDVRVSDFNAYRRCIEEEKEEFSEDILKVFFNLSIDAGSYERISGNKILIVIVSYNLKHMMQENIASIRNTLPAGSYRIAVVDNASTDGTAQWLDEQDDILLIKNQTNAGFGPACNQAVNATMGTECESYDIFLLNNDTRLTDNALYFLKKALYSADDIGAVGSISNYAGNRQQADILFDRVEDYLEYGRKNNVPGRDSIEERVRLSGFAMLIKRSAWDKAGGFDEDFAPGYFEDDALSMELLKNGYRLLLVKNSFIYHAGSQSFSKTDYNSLLEDHRELFIKKYGFDIIDHAYSDEAVLSCINYRRSDEFRLLHMGCGLGAELKAVRSRYPKCKAAGIEEMHNLYSICSKTETVYDSADSVREAYGEGYFDVLLIDDRLINKMSREEKEKLVKLCRSDASLLVKNNEYENIPYDKIKLIVWDLDDTLWNGTLSESEVDIPETNIGLIRMLTDHGIVNSISSKNDEGPVKERLTQAGIWDDFVFNNINWNEKGSQIADKINTMGLRSENVLFIDDNPRNLEEAKFGNEALMTADPGVIPYLFGHYSALTPRDLEHNRLEQYKLLERKTQARSEGTSKEQFLYDSDIRITINRNCMEELDRIHEMVGRTNQLNYTKNRDNKDLLTRQLTNDWNDCAYIRVRDRFGDYGIVGFYCYNMRENRMEHFLFSCRVLGMGVEQYVYNSIGCPAFDVKQPVASQLEKDKPVLWITESQDESITEDPVKNKRVRILLKGPCDMSAIEPYLSGGSITTEFNYINEFGFVTTGQNHTAHIRESMELSAEEIDEIISEAPFIIKGDFATRLFTDKYHVICLSLLQDLSSGLYQNKRTGRYISFSSKNFDLTAPENASRFINKEIQGHDFEFNEGIIKEFSDKWEFIGNTPLDMLLGNLDFIYENIPGKPLIILMLGSETEYEGYNEEFDGLAEVYREINPVIKAFAEDHERMMVVDPTKFIHSQDDFEDCINHFSRNVYYEIAGEICEYINRYV
ncbi:MAG: glycosyltransferase [Lachnospiraceae bacterium]|nr:glycosyltransferase [Lachnospiraceae bacterium]